jgi:hypothetical protein
LLIFFILITFFLKRRRTLKKLVVFLLVSLLAASTAYASELDLSGSFFIQGDIADGANENRSYESDFEVKAAFEVDENTTANLTFEAFDNNWAEGADQTAFEVTTATMTHKFATGTTFNGGYDGVENAWGTGFGDDADDVYYLKVTQDFTMGSVIAWTEKITEDTTAAPAGDDEDRDAYGLGAELKFGEMTVMPAVYYVDDKLVNNANITQVSVAATGAVAGLDVEAEAIYYDSEANKDATYGLYANVSKAIDALTVGGTVIYCSADGTDAFDAGDEMGTMEQIGDDAAIVGWTVLKGSASYAVNDKLTLGGAAAYAMGTESDDDTAVYEINLTASYAISSAVTYSAGYSYLDGDDNTGKELADASVYAYHMINVAF